MIYPVVKSTHNWRKQKTHSHTELHLRKMPKFKGISTQANVDNNLAQIIAYLQVIFKKIQASVAFIKQQE